MTTKGPAMRVPLECMTLATASLPTPFSPRMSSGLLLAEARSICCETFSIFLFRGLTSCGASTLLRFFTSLRRDM